MLVDQQGGNQTLPTDKPPFDDVYSSVQVISVFLPCDTSKQYFKSITSKFRQRLRADASQSSSCCRDALSIANSKLGQVYNVVVDHSSISWGTDEVADIWYDSNNITISRSIISEGLNKSTNRNGGCRQRFYPRFSNTRHPAPSITETPSSVLESELILDVGATLPE